MGSALHWKLDDWPAVLGGQELQFRLVYQGPLPSGGNGSNKAKIKHAIRQQFHPQIKQLWVTHPFLKRYFELVVGEGPDTFPEHIGKTFARCGHNFVPLIGSAFGERGIGEAPGLACALDILILRRDHQANSLVQSGGDIDNRIKVLFDALHIPQSCEGIPAPSEADRLVFCLLENDQLITEVNISTAQLLVEPPANLGHPDQYVHVVIHVKTLVTGASGFTVFMT
jgi:hypothetical protein